MRRLFLLLTVTGLAGCQGTVGPLQRPCNPKPPVDLRCAPIAIQERNRRDQLALPDPSPQLGPQTFTEPPGPFIRGAP
jgi:hypothetical protein